MKFKVNADAMNSALKSTARLFREKTINPILSFYKFTLGEDEMLTIETANDEGVSVSQTITASTEFPESGSFCAPQKIKDIFALIKGDADIVAEEPYTEMTVSCQSGNFTIPCASAETYPERAFKTDGETYVSTDIPAATFCDGIAFCLPFTEMKNTLRPIMRAVNVAVNSGELSIAGTDAQKLAVYTDRADGCPDFSANVAGQYADLFSLLKDKTTATLAYNGKAVRITADDFSFTIPCVEGNYPAYKRIIPTEKSETAHTIVPKAEILRSAAMAGICTDKATKLVRMAVSGETMNILGEDLTGGGKASGFASCESAEFVVGLNIENLRVALNAIAGENVRIGFSAPERPVRLTSDGDAKRVIIVMPVTLQENC